MPFSLSIKNLKIGDKVSTISIESDSRLKSTRENELKALAVLLGGYNRYGRHIDLDKHRERIIIFSDLIMEIAAEMP